MPQLGRILGMCTLYREFKLLNDSLRLHAIASSVFHHRLKAALAQVVEPER
jgi:hypothetical protein